MKTLNRINLLWTLAWVIMLLTGCTTTWTTEAINIITLLGPSITSILAILAAFGVGLSPTVATALTAWSGRAETGLAQVKTLIEQFNTAQATAQPGILAEIQTALGVIDSDLATLLPTIKITNASTQAKIMAVVQSFQSELSALIALVPALQGKVTDHDQFKKLIAAVGSSKQYRSDFNKKVDAFGPTAKQYHI